jgi:uncharacterized membrane protein
MIGDFIFMHNFSFLLIILILIFAVLLARCLHIAKFTPLEIVLLIALPLLAYLSLAMGSERVLNDFNGDIFGLVLPGRFDVPLCHFGGAILGINLIGFAIPVFISLKLLLQGRIPIRETLFLVALISAISYLYTYHQPGIGIVVYFLAIPPILAAAVSFMLQRIARERGRREFNPALLSYAGATIGVVIGADLLNLNTLIEHYKGDSVFIALGGGGVLDAIFLAGLVALVADLIFNCYRDV